MLTTVQEMLERLPRAYTAEMYNEKCQRLYQHIFDRYADASKSVYGTAA